MSWDDATEQFEHVLDEHADQFPILAALWPRRIAVTGLTLSEQPKSYIQIFRSVYGSTMTAGSQWAARPLIERACLALAETIEETLRFGNGDTVTSPGGHPLTLSAGIETLGIGVDDAELCVLRGPIWRLDEVNQYTGIVRDYPPVEVIAEMGLRPRVRTHA